MLSLTITFIAGFILGIVTGFIIIRHLIDYR